MKFLKLILIVGLLTTLGFTKTKENLTFEFKDNKNTTYHVKSTEAGMDIKELRGQVVFLALFGHRCPPCMMEISGFREFTNDAKYNKRAKILALEVQGLNSDNIKDFISSSNINYSVVAGSSYLDFINYIGYRTKWNNLIPFMVVLDTTGKVVDFGNGIVSQDELRDLTDKLSPIKEKK